MKLKANRNLIEQTRYRIIKQIKFLMAHNVNPYYNLVKSFNQGKKRAAMVHAVGTGKSYIALRWIQQSIQGGVVLSGNQEEKPFIKKPDKDVKVLYLAPKLSIFGQVDRHIDGLEMEKLKQHIKFKTYAGLLHKFKDAGYSADLDEEDEFDEIELTDFEQTEFDEYISQFTHIVLDEFHHADENKWGKAVKHALNSNPNAQVLGLSATPIRGTGTNTVDSLFASNVVSTITLADAIVKGILPFPDYKTSVYSYDKLLKEYEERVENIGSETKRIEGKKTVEDIKRLLTNAHGAKDVLIEQLKRYPNGKFIVFCDDIATSEKYMQEITEMLKDDLEVSAAYNINSSNPNSQKEIEEFEKTTGKGIKLLFAVDMLNEGVHIDDIDGVIMMRDTNSFIVYQQQLGRALSSGKKVQPLVLDLVDNIDSAFDYRNNMQSIRRLFIEIGKHLPQAQEIVMQLEKEDVIMNKFRSLDELMGRTSTEDKLKIIKHAISQNPLPKGITKTKDGKFFIAVACQYEYEGLIKNIGAWINTLKTVGIADKSFKEGLLELNIDLSSKKLSDKEKLEMIKQIIIQNPLPDGVELTEEGKYLFSYTFNWNYNNREHSVGRLVGAIKRTPDTWLYKELEKLNVDLNKYAEKVSDEDKIKILKHVLNQSTLPKDVIKLNNGEYRISHNTTYTYEGKTYNIGHWISNLKIRDNNGNLKRELEALKINLDAQKISDDFKIEVLKDVIKQSSLPSNITKTKDGKLHIPHGCQYSYKNRIYNIGAWIQRAINKPGSYLYEEFQKMDIDMYEVKHRYSDDEKVEIIKTVISQNPLPEKVRKTKEGKFKISADCKYIFNGETVNIGALVDIVKYKPESELYKKLEKLNIDLSRQYEKISDEEKIKIIKHAISQNPLPEYISKTENGQFYIPHRIVYIYDGKKHNIGRWIENAKITPNGELYKSLEKLNIDLGGKQITNKLKLEVIASLIAEKVLQPGVRKTKEGKFKIAPLCKYTYKNEEYNVGNWIQNLKRLGTGGEEFKNGLIALNIDLSVRAKKQNSTAETEQGTEV